MRIPQNGAGDYGKRDAVAQPAGRCVARVCAVPESTEHYIQTMMQEELTSRESEVLALVARGHTLAQIGKRLGITRNTVHTHLKRVYQKLGISTRPDAVLQALRLRLIRL